MSMESKVWVPDVRFYSENRAKYPPDDLMKYDGQWVAWSPDGMRILATGFDFDETVAAMKALGLDPFDAVWDHRPPDDGDSFL